MKKALDDQFLIQSHFSKDSKKNNGKRIMQKKM